jgi:hypothetical protein
MVKIKGWKKTLDNGFITQWVHKTPGQKDNIVIQIAKSRTGYDYRISNDWNYSKRFDTKEQAVNHAIKYMRSHPNG